MNITDIPRYKSSFPVQTQFITNADATGDHVFTQVKRTGNVCLYSRTRVENGRVFGYEVVILTVMKAGTVFAKGAEPTKTDAESYPGGQSFGKKAWFFPTLESAQACFDRVVNGKSEIQEESIVEESNTIPEGEFTAVEFSTANCLPPVGKGYSILQSLLADGKIKVSRREQRGRGRPTVLYTKV